MKYCVVFIFMVILTIDLKCQTFVKQDAKGANNGKSWKDAYVNLDTAISRTNSGEIWVAAGTYKPTTSLNFSSNPLKSFYISKKIALYGGFKGIETEIYQRDITNNPTVLSGDIGEAGNDLDNTPIVVYISGDDIDSTTILDGFTITKSYYKNGDNYQTGAVLIGNSNPIIRNCTIKENFGFEGGGISIYSSNPLIYNNLITNNIAYEGAGIYIEYSVDSAHIVGNQIINNKCTGGYSHLAGGGIYVGYYSAPYIIGNQICSNYAGNYGGGISIESNYSVVISNNIISYNTSSEGGGINIDFSSTALTNNLIVNNKSDNGGGIYAEYSPKINSINNTIANNYAESNGNNLFLSAIKMKMLNTIVYDSAGSNSIYVIIGRTDWFPKIEYSNIQNGIKAITTTNAAFLDSIWQTNNIVTNPVFVDEFNGNYNLKKESPCINSGKEDTTGLGIGAKDASGNNRISYNCIDIGCYEFDSLISENPIITASPQAFFIEGYTDSIFELSIKTGIDWQIINGQSWIELSENSGSGNAVVSITTHANPNLYEERTTTIFITGKSFYPIIPVTIMQSSGSYLIATPNTIDINQFGSNNPSFTINSNLNWYISTTDNWYTLSKYSGFKNDKIFVNAKTNSNNTSRTGTIKIYGNNGWQEFSQTINLIQQSKTGVTETKAGYKVYPNPVYDKLTIDIFQLIGSGKIYVYSGSGSLVYSADISTNQITVDMGSYESGFYYLIIESDNKHSNFKITKY